MSFMLPWSVIWLAFLGVAGIMELVTAKRFALMLMPPAIVSLILSLFSVLYPIQLVVFGVLACAGIVIRLCLLRHGKTTGELKGMDDLIGQCVTVTSKIENLAGNGEVQVNGMFFAARSAEEEKIYEIGDSVTVIAVEGVKLICK